MEDSRLQEYAGDMAVASVLLAIISVVAEIAAYVAGDTGVGVYFSLGLLSVLTAIISAASASAKYLQGYKGITGATLAWAVTGIWFCGGMVQFARAVALH